MLHFRSFRFPDYNLWESNGQFVMRHYTSNNWNRRAPDASIRESILERISACIRMNGHRLEDIRSLDGKITRPEFQALKDGVDGYISKDRLQAIAEGLEVLNGVHRCAA